MSASLALTKTECLLAEDATSGGWRTFEVKTRVEMLESSGATRVWLPAALIGMTPFQKTLSNDFRAEGGTARIVEGRADWLGIVAAEFPAGVKPVLTLTSRIATKNCTVDLASPDEIRAAGVHLAAEAKPGKYICISFSDSGSGMSQEVMQRAFEPFFTTKDVGQGSGLGLSQVYGFIRQSGGILTVDTEIDAGTTFSLYLPRVEAGAGVAPQERESEVAAGGRETILIVEDNPLVLDFAVSTVTDLGYQVLLADDARSALDILGGSGPVDLLFTDIVLPNRMNGIELAHEARRLRPGLRVLMTSGYSGGAEGAERSQREFPFLVKPYGHRDLARRIREVLTEV